MDTMTSEQRNDLERRLQEAGSRLVDREVVYCISSLVYTMAQAYGHEGPKDVQDMAEQAFELSTALPDYEEAAEQNGATLFQDDDGDWKWKDEDGNESDDFWSDKADAAQNYCEKNRVDTDDYGREVYEHWIVSRWLADKLQERGERVDRDFAGMIVWARTTTGQAISLDHVIRQIVIDLGWHKKDGE